MINNLNHIYTQHTQKVIELISEDDDKDVDGVIFLETTPAADFRMNYFNKDGTGDALCGNGLRCTMKFINDNSISDKRELNLEAVGKIYNCKVLPDDQISVMFPPPTLVKTNFKLKVHFQEWWELLNCSYVECGSPHVVVFIDEIEKPRVTSLDEVNISEWGRNIRMHKDLLPEGANVNFVKTDINEKDKIVIRSFERGVEGETMACGTGAISSALIYYLLRSQSNPVKVLTRSGEYLTVELIIEDKKLKGINLTGNAVKYK